MTERIPDLKDDFKPIGEEELKRLASQSPLNRITMILQLRHEAQGDIHEVNTNVSRILDSNEQPYSRRFVLSVASIPLIPEKCWIQPDDVGYFTLENLAGKRGSVNPTKEQMEIDKTKIIEVGGEWLVYPGWTFSGFHKDIDKLTIRGLCVTEAIPVKLTLFPK